MDLKSDALSVWIDAKTDLLVTKDDILKNDTHDALTVLQTSFPHQMHHHHHHHHSLMHHQTTPSHHLLLANTEAAVQTSTPSISETTSPHYQELQQIHHTLQLQPPPAPASTTTLPSQYIPQIQQLGPQSITLPELLIAPTLDPPTQLHSRILHKPVTVRNSSTISSKSIAVDTIDLEYYAPRLSDISTGIRPLTRSIAIDTSDLENHYEFYKHPTPIIRKNVYTDTNDLVQRTERRYDQLTTTSSSTTTRLPETINSLKIESKENSNPSLKDSDWDSDCMSDRDNLDKAFTNEEDPEFVCKVSENDTNPITMTLRSIDHQNDDENQTSANDGKFPCEICGAKFTRKHSMMIHLRKHNGEKPFVCPICSKAFPTKVQLVRHQRTHTGEKPYECEICFKRFCSKQEVKYHNLIHEGVKPHVCPYCGRQFRWKAQIKKHKCVKETEDGCFSCGPCGEVFNTKQSLLQHEKMSHPDLVVPRPQTQSKEKKHECLICGKRFYAMSALKIHHTVHTGEKPHKCDICGKCFPTKTCLKAHTNTHTGVKPYTCSTCGKAFAKNDSLKIHMRKHTGEKPFECDECGMAFDRNFTLKNHKLIHTGEKTNICATCGKAFATRGALGTHERNHHYTGEKPRKPYKRREKDFEKCMCDICGKVYSNQGNLRLHKVIHTGERSFQCNVCGKAFAKKYTLQCHTRKHTDERPFACDVCGQTFYRNSTLKTHKLRHTGEKPHVCQLCGKAFTQSCSLAYHLRHHNRPPKAPPKRKQRKRKSTPNPHETTMIPAEIPEPLHVQQPTLLHHPQQVTNSPTPQPPPPPPQTQSQLAMQHHQTQQIQQPVMQNILHELQVPIHGPKMPVSTHVTPAPLQPQNITLNGGNGTQFPVQLFTNSAYITMTNLSQLQ